MYISIIVSLRDYNNNYKSENYVPNILLGVL